MEYNFQVGDLVFCSLPEHPENYRYKRDEPLLIKHIDDYGSYFLTQDGLWHAYRKRDGEYCLSVFKSNLRPHVPAIPHWKVIQKIKYLNKRYEERNSELRV